jgi:hypothetical protein
MKHNEPEIQPALRIWATLTLLAIPVWVNAFSNDAFECYVAVYTNLTDPPSLKVPALRVGLHPKGNDPVLHIYADRLKILPLKALTISDRFIRGQIYSNDKIPVELGSLLLRQRGLTIRFNLTQSRRGSSEPITDLSMRGECSSIGYRL